MRNKAETATSRAKSLRSEMSLVEVLFWKRVRASQLGVVVRRQFPVGPYVLDFYVPCVRLCIELDGQSHDLRFERDLVRDQYLDSQEISVFRIPAGRILKELDLIIDMVYSEIERLKGMQS